jgi:hypothetical protein
MDPDEKKLDTKLKQLAIAVGRSKQALESGKTESIKRHLQALREIIREANNAKQAAEAVKIDNSEDIEKIDEWNNEVEAKLEIADAEIERLQKWISEKELSEEIVAEEGRLKLELAMHEKKLKMQHELSKTEPEIKEFASFQTAKLPKLVISKFDGSFMDWTRFWGQFTEAIDTIRFPPLRSLHTFASYCVQRSDDVSKRCHSQPKAITVPRQYWAISTAKNPKLLIATLRRY